MERPKLIELPALDAQTCFTCNFYRSAAKDGGFCRRNPPTVFLVPRQTTLGQMEPQAITQFPPVKADWDCGEWRGRN